MKQLCNNSFYLLLIMLCSIIIIGKETKACTSFAVYSSNIYFGLNLDWQNTEMKFSIRQNEGYKVFNLELLSGSNWLISCGFNEHGLLSTSQMVNPGVNAVIKPNEIPVDFGALYRISTDFFSDTDSLKDFFQTTQRRLIQVQHIKLHSLLAGINGSAFVAESGTDSNMFTTQENNFVVMTNFNNHYFWGKPYTQVTGLGADRYKTAYEYIQENVSNFSIDNGWEVLKRVKQTSGSYPTICSLVFDPLNKYVYIVLHRNFTKVYRVSVTENYIETYSGFDTYVKLDLGADGITSTNLLSITKTEENEIASVKEFNLQQNYPNPFNAQTVIRFSVPFEQKVEIKIYDILGNEIDCLIDDVINTGEYTTRFDASNLPSGVYYCCLKTKRYSKTIKVMLTK